MLERINEDVKTQALAVKWLSYLLQQVNHDALKNLLKYYTKVGWIGEYAESQLIALADGIKSAGGKEWKVPARVHMVSLLFIYAMQDIPVEKELAGMNSYIRMWIENPDEVLSL